MTVEIINGGLSFAASCNYLTLSPDDLVELREQGLVACVNQNGKQIYPQVALNITRRLLALGQQRGWANAALAWYADLVFATEVGRAILLPISGEGKVGASSSTNWLETSYATSVLQDLNTSLEDAEGPFVALLRSLTAVALGEGQFWPNRDSLENSSLFPIIAHLETSGIPILDQGTVIARDAGTVFAGMMLAFINIAPPISRELDQLTRSTYSRLKGFVPSKADIPAEEQAIILKQANVAVDKIYAAKSPEIHAPPQTWDFKLGVISAEKQSITLELKLPIESNEEIIDNIIDLIRPYVGAYGARVVHLLYEIANDPPYWRNPLVTVDTNELLDRLGLRRDDRGFHRSNNRERLRNVLNMAHSLEIVGEYTTWENGTPERKALRRTVLSLIGATYDPDESRDLSTAELFKRGLPKTMQIRLNFYEGVRRLDGRLGNEYILMPRLAEPKSLTKANYSSTPDLLRAYFIFRYRQMQMKSRELSVTRQTALEKANIKTKHVTRATQILTRALDKLVADGTLEQYEKIPNKPQQSFLVILSNQVVTT
jgi:hypothetical protein